LVLDFVMRLLKLAVWNSLTANSPESARVYRTTIAGMPTNRFLVVVAGSDHVENLRGAT
jgi:hypothetical protein